jgi:hypothetical protein
MALSSILISSIVLLFVKEPERGRYLNAEQKIFLE